MLFQNGDENLIAIHGGECDNDDYNIETLPVNATNNHHHVHVQHDNNTSDIPIIDHTTESAVEVTLGPEPPEEGNV